ncbi:unnamed protein product [Closterium sp. NIES-53]
MSVLPEVDCGPKAWTVLKELHVPTSVVATLMQERELSTLRLSEGEPVQPVLDKIRDLYANGFSLPQNQNLWTLEWVRTKILEEDFRRRQLRGGDDSSSSYGMQGSRRGRGRGFGGAGRGAKKDDDSNDQQGGTSWGRGAKSGCGGKSGQFFHIGEQGEQGDASAKVGAELHPLDYWVLDTGAAWTMTLHKELRDDVAGAGRAAFKGSDGKPVVLSDVLPVPDLKANLMYLHKLANAGVSTSTDAARTYKRQPRNRVLWDLHESKDVYRSMWQLPALAWHGGGHAGEGSASQGGSKKPLELVHMDLVGPLPVQRHNRYFLAIVDDWNRLMWAYRLKQKDHSASMIREDWLPFVEKQAECVVKRIRTDLGGEFLGAETTAWLKKQGIQRELTTAYTPQFNGVAERANRTILETARALLIESGVGNSMWPHAVQHATLARNRVLTKVGDKSWVLFERWLGRKPPVAMLRVFGCMAVHVPKKYRSQHWVPMEKWSGKKLLVDMLRVFGFMGLVHVPKEKHDKLQAAAVWAVHLDLALGSNCWLMWDPKSNTIFTTRDAKFMEGLMFKEWSERWRSKVTIPLGIEKREAIDFQEVFALVAKAPTLWVLLTATAVCGWKVEQMDVKMAFLYGMVDKEIYIKQPERYDDGGRRVCKLNKAIYGLKQVPRCWYARLVEGLEALGFKVSGCDESLFMTEGEEEKVFLLALGPVGYYLGLHVERDEVKGWLRLHQHKYLAAMGKKYGLEEGRCVKTPLPS